MEATSKILNTIFAIVWLILYMSTQSFGQGLIKTSKTNQTGREYIGLLYTTTFDGQAYVLSKFLGIPFAQSPVGDRRFALPQPVIPSSDSYDATQLKNICMQRSVFGPPCDMSQTMSEDCLYLNIYAPVPTFSEGDVQAAASSGAARPLPVGIKYPVYVFIHGGGYAMGNGNCIDGSVLAGYGEVIIVTINYRLGALGFLSTSDGVIPGNLGLWDQHQAIKWVSENIQAFGGDPTRISVGGGSAGGFSSIFLALYSGSDKLFQRIISHSGTPASPKSVNKNPYNSTLNVANALGCNITGTSKKSLEIKACLLKIDGRTLANIFPFNPVPLSVGLLPTVEEPFMPVDPYDILAQKSTPDPSRASVIPAHFTNKDILVGLTAQDGENVYRFMSMPPTFGVASNVTINPEAFKKLVADYLANVTGQDAPEIIKEAALDRYADWSRPNDLIFLSNQALKFLTDVFYAVPVLNTVLSHVLPQTVNASRTGGSTFVYVFRLPKTNEDYKKQWITWFEGTEHGADIPYIFGMVNESDAISISKNFMSYLSNFMKTGNPNQATVGGPQTSGLVTWKQFTDSERAFINMSLVSVSTNQLAADSHHFWYDLVPLLRQYATAQVTFGNISTLPSGGIISNPTTKPPVQGGGLTLGPLIGRGDPPNDVRGGPGRDGRGGPQGGMRDVHGGRRDGGGHRG
ncbi:unnamed protein product [Lymnaea stagnalis]|uniref:Carboxylic ester hydrolase n=1 Tax=Lymnaea stagnalis TaxID=6523 RepID=A0AAV2HDM0_LYMST